VTLSDWSRDPGFRHDVAAAEAASAPYWGDLYVAESLGTTYIDIRSPVRRAGRVVGVLIAGVSIAELSSFLHSIAGPYTRNTFILYGGDRVLAHSALADTFPGLSDSEPLPALTQVGDPVLAALWDDAIAEPVDSASLGGASARALRLGEDRFLVLYREVEGFGPEPLLVGTYLRAGDAGEEMARLGTVTRVGVVIVIVALFLALGFAGALGRPLRRLAVAAERIRELDLEGAPSLRPGPFREVNQAAAAFNAMVSGLRWFATYVHRPLVLRLMRQGSPALPSETRVVTVLFTDLVGFTAMAEHLPAPEVAAFLSEHFALSDRCVEAEGATIDKYIGDAVMAFWGAPEEQPDHAIRACRTAMAIGRAIRADNLARRAAHKAPLRVRIGVHTGAVVVGNIGAPSRVNYTIIGDVVNTAERLEAITRDLIAADIEVVALIGPPTAAALGPGFPLRSLGAQTLRGRAETLEVFCLDCA